MTRPPISSAATSFSCSPSPSQATRNLSPSRRLYVAVRQCEMLSRCTQLVEMLQSVPQLCSALDGSLLTSPTVGQGGEVRCPRKEDPRGFPARRRPRRLTHGRNASSPNRDKRSKRPSIILPGVVFPSLANIAVPRLAPRRNPPHFPLCLRAKNTKEPTAPSLPTSHRQSGSRRIGARPLPCRPHQHRTRLCMVPLLLRR